MIEGEGKKETEKKTREKENEETEQKRERPTNVTIRSEKVEMERKIYEAKQVKTKKSITERTKYAALNKKKEERIE